MALPRKHRKQVSLSVRVTARERTAFHAKSHQHGGASEVLRELVMAFLEDRLTILPPPPSQLFKDLSHVSRSQD